MEFTLALVLWGAPLGGPPPTQPGDRWFARDKALHLGVSLVVQGASHAVLRANGFDYPNAAWTAGATTLAVGVSKELWDRHAGRVFSWKDLAVDGVGGGVGAVIVRQVDR